MKQFFLLLFTTLGFLTTQAQSSDIYAFVDVTASTKPMVKKDKIVVSIEEYKAKEQAILRQIQAQVVYPDLAIEQGLEGRVVLRVDYNQGEIKMTPVEKLGLGCEEAVMEAVQSYVSAITEHCGLIEGPSSFLVPFEFSLQ